MSVPLSQTYGVERNRTYTGPYRVELSRVVSVWPRKVFLQWRLTGNPVSTPGYTTTIHRGASTAGPWELVASNLLDTFYYVDDQFPAPNDNSEPGLFSMKSIMYYRVSVSHLANPQTAEAVGQLNGGTDQRRAGILRKLRRDAEISLRKGSGTEVAVLKRRWWGTPCTCKSATGVVTRSNCSLCSGTGIVSGYWNPVYTFASRSESPRSEQTSSQGTVETHYARLMLPHIPEVRPRDIIVFLRDNKRFIVESENYVTSIQTQPVHQELTASEISASSVEYNIPVDPWHTPEWF